MSERRTRITTLARHEYRAAARSGVLLVLVCILVVVTVASVYVAATDYAGQLADFQAYKAAAKAQGSAVTAPSPLVLLALLRGAFEYIEIMGAVVAIALGYLSVSRERANRTLPLLRSRPVTAGELTVGSMLGALTLIATILAAAAAVAIICLGAIGHTWVHGTQIPKLGLAYLAAVIYMFVFYCLGALVTARTKVVGTGLLLSLGVWLIVVLILPQIGDTLDADNQVPGGLFAALGLGHAGEVTILQHLSVYETIRNGIESASFEKHFERFAFAMIDIVPRYRSLSVGQLIHEKAADVGWMIFYLFALVAGLWRTFHVQPATSRGEN